MFIIIWKKCLKVQIRQFISSHYSQHKGSVANARKGALERMQQLGVSDDFTTLGGSHSNLAASTNPQLCTVPCDR